MGTGIFAFGIAVVLSVFFLWTNHNGQKADRERDWS
jgi:nitrogen fixation-related uncharacterized protein